MVVRFGHIDERTVGFERELAVRRRRFEDGRKGVAVGVRVVGQHARRRCRGQRRVLCDLIGVGRCSRHVLTTKVTVTGLDS